MDKNKATKKEFGLGIISAIIGTICILIGHRSEIIANCMGQGTNSCPNQFLVLPILLLITLGLTGVVFGTCLMESNHSALFTHNKIKKEVKA